MELQIYTINLKRSKDRYNFQKEMEKKINHEIKFFEAIDKLDLTKNHVKNLLKDGIIEKNYTNCHTACFYKNFGSLGCALSHFYLWDLIKNDNIYTLITEDDNEYINDNFTEEISKYLFPEGWDIIFFNYEDEIISRFKEYNTEFYTIKNGYGYKLGCYCYLVNRNFVNKLLNYKINDHIDNFITNIGLNIYITKKKYIKHNYSFESDRVH